MIFSDGLELFNIQLSLRLKIWVFRHTRIKPEHDVPMCFS